jgi:hypothetical protein
MATAMLTTTTAGFYECRTQNLTSSDPAAVAAHMQRNSLTMGFSVQFAVNRSTGEVVQIIKKGKLCRRDVAPLIAQGFDEWLYSWAFSGKRFRLDDGREVKLARVIDLMTRADVAPWARAMGAR